MGDQHSLDPFTRNNDANKIDSQIALRLEDDVDLNDPRNQMLKQLVMTTAHRSQMNTKANTTRHFSSAEDQSHCGQYTCMQRHRTIQSQTSVQSSQVLGDHEFPETLAFDQNKLSSIPIY